LDITSKKTLTSPSVVSNARKHPANIKLILIKVNNNLPLGR